MHEAGFVMTDAAPDFVVLGETRTYSFEAITKAIRLINDGARFIATNPDVTGPSAEGVLPATGAVAALITAATKREPYYVGKPNPMMFRSAMNKLGAHSERTGMIGDRMDTDVVAGIEAGLHTILVLIGHRQPQRCRSLPVPARRDPGLGSGSAGRWSEEKQKHWKQRPEERRQEVGNRQPKRPPVLSGAPRYRLSLSCGAVCSFAAPSSGPAAFDPAGVDPVLESRLSVASMNDITLSCSLASDGVWA